MRFEVPQFIEIEDKVVGPLTWRQFVYIAGGVGMLVVLYLTTPLVIFIFLGLPLGGLAFSLAFHKINNRPFSIFLESVVNYTTQKKLYLWKKDTTQTLTEMPGRNTKPPHVVSDNEGSSINSLSNKLNHQLPK